MRSTANRSVALPLLLTCGSVLVVSVAGCAHVKVDPIEVKPIHIVHDINIRVDRQLDEFFAFQEKAGSTTQPATTTVAAPAQTAGAQQGVTP